MTDFSLNKSKPFSTECFRLVDGLSGDIKRGVTSPPDSLDVGIHSARKAMKKLSALLWLLNALTDDRKYLRINKRVRSLAKRLSALRDGLVKLHTLEDIENTFKVYIKPALIQELKDELLSQYENELAAWTRENAAEDFLYDYTEIEKKFSKLLSGTKNLNLSLAVPFIVETYKQNRRHRKNVEKSLAAEEFHAWRHLVKRHWYLVRLIEVNCPDSVRSYYDLLDDLGESLGLHHDMYVLQEYLNQQRVDGKHYIGNSLIVALTYIRQNQLAEQIILSSKNVYGDKPREYREWLSSCLAS